MRIITKAVWVLSFVSLLADLASEILYPVIPVYLKEIGFSVFLIGLLEGIAGFIAGISKGYFGKLSDEKGLRLPFVKTGYLLSAVSKPLLAFFSFPVWIFFARTLDRLGKGVRTAARDALLSQEAVPETKARVFGFHRGMDTIGAVIGPVLALLYLYLNPGHYSSLFLMAFIPGLLSFLLLYLLHEKKQMTPAGRKGNFFSYLNYWHKASPQYRKVVGGLLVFALFNSSDMFLLLITKESIGNKSVSIAGLGFSADLIVIAAYIFYNLIFALTSYPLGIMADKTGFRKVTILGFFLFAFVYGGFAFDPSLAIIFFLFFVYGIFAAATEGVIKAWITNLAPQNTTATAIGFYTSCESICALVASLMAGAIWTLFGSAVLFVVAAGVSICVGLYFLLIIKEGKN